MNPMLIFWIVLMVALLILEASTVCLVSIWFAGGALAAMIVTLCGGGILLQCALFLAVSAILLACLWPLRKKIQNRAHQATNADRVIGMTAVVLEPIDNIRGTGSVRVDGKVWTARTVDGSTVEADTLVIARKIEGVKLYVEKVPANTAV